MSKKIWFLLAIISIANPIFAADPLYEIVKDLINDSVVPWTRLIGGLGFIVTIIGAIWAKREQSDSLRVWLTSSCLALGVFSIPEFLNWLMQKGGASDINFG